MKKLINLFITAFMTTLCLPAFSQTAPQNSNRSTVGLMLFDAEYETTNKFDVEGQILYGAFKSALNPKFSLGGGIGLMLDGKIGNSSSVDDGQGFKIFVDGQYLIRQKGATSFALTGALSHDRYTFESGNLDIDWTMTEIKFGGLAIHKTGNASIYGGLEVFIYSNGEVGNTDVERDDKLNLRLGGSFALDSTIDLRADLLLLTEETVTLAIDFIL